MTMTRTLGSLVLSATAMLTLCAGTAQAAPVLTPSNSFGKTVCTSAGKAVDAKGYMRIGGIDQWVRIKGSNCANPLVLIVHGGPGNPSTPYADQVYKSWEKEFTLVQWDQRGAGKTYARNRPAEDEPLVVERLRDDGIELARETAKLFGKRKVILMGGSWGSMLAVHMVKSWPEAFCAYVGTGQLVGRFGNQDSYDATLALARAAGDQESITKLEALGPPPWTNPRNPGILRRVTRKYEALGTDPAPASWWAQSPEYTSEQTRADYTAGEDYSWLQFVGYKGDGIASKVDLYKLGTDFAVPVFLLQGEQDLVTMPASSKRYFDSISAPRKQFVMLPRTGHDPNPAMIDAQLKLLKEVGTCR